MTVFVIILYLTGDKIQEKIQKNILYYIMDRVNIKKLLPTKEEEFPEKF